MYRFIMLLIIFSLISGCSSLKIDTVINESQIQAPNKTYLIIVTEVINGDLLDVKNSLKFICNNNINIHLPVEKKYTEVNSVKEGIHYLYEIKSYDKNTGNLFSIIKENMVFSTEENSVTIFQKKMIIYLKSNKNIDRINFKDLSQAEIEDCINLINIKDEYQGLNIKSRY